MSYVEKIQRDDGTVDYMIEDSRDGSVGVVLGAEWEIIKQEYGVDENSENLWDIIDEYEDKMDRLHGGPRFCWR